MNIIELGVSDYRFAPVLAEIPSYIKFNEETLFTGSPNKRCLAVISNTSYDTFQKRGHNLPMVRMSTLHSGPAGGICDPDDIFFNLVHRNELEIEDIKSSIITALRNCGLMVDALPNAGIPFISIPNIGDYVIGTSPLTNGPYNGWYVTFWYIRLAISKYEYSSAYKENVVPCLELFAGSTRQVNGILDLYPMLSKKQLIKNIADQLSLTFNFGLVSYKNKKSIDFINVAKRTSQMFLNDSWLYDNIHP